MTDLSLGRRSRRRRKILSVLQTLLATVFTCIVVFPLYWMLISSLKTEAEMTAAVPTLWPQGFRWENYVAAFTKVPLMRYIGNTIITTIGYMFLQTFFGILAAYSFSRGEYKGRDVLFLLVLGALMIPIQVTFIPVYRVVAKLHWVNTFPGIIVPNAVSAYFIFLLRQNFMSVDNSYIEAGQVDGMGHFRIIFQVLVPICRPVIITMCLITFMNGWNSYFWPKVITTNQSHRVITLGIMELKQSLEGFINNYNEIMAGAVISIVPVAILFMIFQRFILTGLSKNAMK